MARRIIPAAISYGRLPRFRLNAAGQQQVTLFTGTLLRVTLAWT
jgi:hypothetical protein